jgi:hypothetical protein
VFKEEEKYGDWKKLHNEELHNSCSEVNNISDQIKNDKIGGMCRTHVRYEKLITILVGNAERIISCWSNRRR